MLYVLPESKINFLIIVAFFFPFVPIAAAQAPTPITLKACVEEALQKNPAAVLAKQTEESALEDVGAAKGRYYPEALFRSGFRRWETHVFLPEGVGSPGFQPTVGPVNEWRANLRAQYTVFDSGLRSSELKSAESQYSATQEESFRTRSEIVYSVYAAFYELLAAEDEVELAKLRIERSQDHLRLATDRKEAGAVPQADVTRARVDVSSAELTLVAAESSLRIASGNLNRAMGRMPHERLQVARIELNAPDPGEIDVPQSLTRALEKRPEVQAGIRRVDAKRSQIGAVRSEILPKVRAEAGYGWLEEEFVPKDRDWWIGVTLDIPLFDGGARSHRSAKSKVEVNREQTRLDQTKLSIQQEVWSAHSRWVEAHQSLQTNRARKEQAEESLRLTKARYEEGADTINDLLDAELALDQSETSLNNARYQLFVAQAAFLLASGEL